MNHRGYIDLLTNDGRIQPPTTTCYRATEIRNLPRNTLAICHYFLMDECHRRRII